MTLNEIRQKYLDFYKNEGHAVIPSAPLLPKNDPTTLFTGSGMQPLVPYLLGKDHPEGKRLVDSQKSFRSMDIEEVGDNRHTTFFEMLGNWSLGDYFKKEQLPWVFKFITEEIGLDPNKIYVTVFIGDEKNNVPRDTESVVIWKELFAAKGIEAKDVLIGSEDDGYNVGMQGGRIFYYDSKKNWWSRAGVPEKMPAGEPGGPDSEIFYDFGTPHDTKWGPECHPNCDCGRFLEIGNSVFMQYIKQEDGSFALLPKQNVDFGGGLERIVAAKNNDPDVFKIDAFAPIISFIETQTGKKYGESEEVTKAFRVIADHMRAATFLIADGCTPSNSDQGYFVRRLLRRAVRYADKLGMTGSGLSAVVAPIADIYGDAYPEVSSQKETIIAVINEEEDRFRETLTRGMKEFEKIVAHDNIISGTNAFLLFATYGFPLEMTQELAAEKGARVNLVEYQKEFEQHKLLSRAGSEQKFKGGLADASEATTRLHTTHHLLLKALQMVLGDHVHQRGSNITAERLRIDFSHPEKVTPEQLAEVEKIVNEKIKEGIPMIRSVMPKEEAEKLGAEHEFGSKYPDTVSVYSLGPKDATEDNPEFEKAFSIEFCGGPHVSNTAELGTFKIQKEEAVAAGVRRIKATLT
jgi:alanyl-tRNA synthetase